MDTNPPAKLVDVSHNNGVIKWPLVKAAGYDGAFCKFTESDNFIDPQSEANWAGILDQGLVRGAYHFFHPMTNPALAANLFLKQVRVAGLLSTDILILDWETHEGIPAQELLAGAQWLDIVQQATGKTPVVYMGPGYAHALALAGIENMLWLNKYPLWLAEYNTTANVPAPWTGYSFWQFTSHDSVPGINGRCDESVAGGDLDWLVNFAK